MRTVGAPASPTPVDAPCVPPARCVRASRLHACATGENGARWCWGHACCDQITAGNADAAPPTRVDIACPRA